MVGLAVALAAATVLPFLPVFSNGFVNYDDPKYIVANEQVRAGLSAAGFVWAWTTTLTSNWHPLTWLSHMLDVQMFGNRAAGHHAISVLIHAASVVLLFLALNAATERRGTAAAAALLFAVHPLRVESVAWAAERKDVLATFFWVLATYAHVVRARHPSSGRSTVVAVAMAAGLLAKPMLVTLPFALLLLDVWPLSRWTGREAAWPLVREKIPLFVLAAASSVVTLVVQSRVAIQSLAVLPLPGRIANAMVAYVSYLGKTILPVRLAPFYPNRGSGIPPWEMLLATAVLAAVTAGVVAMRRRAPYLLVGWAWFVGTLVPVIGIVQVGGQGMADRYTYVPSIGLAVAAAWGAQDLLRGYSNARTVAALAAAAALMPMTWAQTARWRDSETLFRHAIAVTEENDLAHNNLGVALEEQGRLAEAIEHYREALRFRNGNREARLNLALALARAGQREEALSLYRRLVVEFPGDPDVRNNLGSLLLARGEAAAAIPHLEVATRARTPFPVAWRNLALALRNVGRSAEARAAWATARAQGAPPDPALDAPTGEPDSVR